MNVYINLYIFALFFASLRRIQAKNPDVVPVFVVPPPFAHRVDVPRRIAAIFQPYQLSTVLDSEVVCRQFQGWHGSSPAWDRKLNPYNLTLCAKDFGGGGNCMYHVIAGSLKENGYKIGKFDLERHDLKDGIKISLRGLGFDPSKFFSMQQIRILAALAYVGIDPTNPLAQNLLDVEQLKEKLGLSVIQSDSSPDIKWNPGACLKDLEQKKKQPIDVAKEVFKNLVSSNPVMTWGSGEDLYALAELLNVDFILFHREDQKIQHIMGPGKTPVCTINIYYLDMCHFQSGGIVVTHTNSDARSLTNVYRHFQLDEALYPLVVRSNAAKDKRS